MGQSRGGERATRERSRIDERFPAPELGRTNDSFRQADPLQKSRVISALKAVGNTVGFLGDGINDAAALREADVGISVDTGVQSGWFVEGLLSQTLIVHMIRTRRVPFFQSWPCAPLLFTTMVIVALGAILPSTAIGSAIGLVRLPPVYFFWLAGILFSYCLVVQTVKIWFLRRFKAWI
jgi:magnesium-transporting ATPase (P-type)